MSDLLYLYISYTIIWAGIFLYVIRLHLIQRKLKKEIKMLKETLNDKTTKKNL